jgi:hypothetical protein
MIPNLTDHRCAFLPTFTKIASFRRSCDGSILTFGPNVFFVQSGSEGLSGRSQLSFVTGSNFNNDVFDEGGAIYDRGLGVPQNLVEAAKWFKRSAEQGQWRPFMTRRRTSSDDHERIGWLHFKISFLRLRGPLDKLSEPLVRLPRLTSSVLF